MNLLHKLYFVYDVSPPVPEEEEAPFVTVLRTHDDYLGCSRVHGAFTDKREALKFASKLAKKLKVRLEK